MMPIFITRQPGRNLYIVYESSSSSNSSSMSSSSMSSMSSSSMSSLSSSSTSSVSSSSNSSSSTTVIETATTMGRYAGAQYTHGATLPATGLGGNYVVSFWGKVTGGGAGYISSYIDSFNPSAFVAYINSQGRVSVWVQSSSGNYKTYETAAIHPTTTLSHYVMQWNTTTKTASLYVNGVSQTLPLIASSGTVGSINTGVTPLINYLLGVGQVGQMASLKVGSTLLDGADVTELYNDGNPKQHSAYSPALKAKFIRAYEFANDIPVDGQERYDLINNQHATLIGMTFTGDAITFES